MNASRAVAAGAVGTATMTALLLIEPSVGLPTIAMGQVLSTALGFASAFVGYGAAVGWVVHFAVGIFWALLFAAVFEKRIPGPSWLQGLVYGALVFLLAQLLFMPLVGGGVFSRGDLALIAGSLLGHLVYGMTMAWTYEVPGRTV